MIYDLNKNYEQNEDQIFDICIIGAGAAGISLAKKFSEANLNTALCEAGSLEYSEESQDIYKGKIVGDKYFDLDVTRLRYLGGSTNHWNGWCRSFEKIDFKRNYLGKEFQWPISLSDIDSYRDEACKILEIKNDFEFKNQESPVKKFKFQFSPPVRFGEKYYDLLSSSKNIKVFLNANFIDFEGENRLVKTALFQNYKKEKKAISANFFIFAMGGIENPRFLLWLAKKHNEKYFDTNTPIGKYWIEHPNFTLGKAIVDKKITDHPFYSISENEQINSKILSCGFRINKLSSSSSKSLLKNILCIAPKYGEKIASLYKKGFVCGAMFFASWEQKPDIENAVKLSQNLDKFGIPRVELNWKKTSFDRKTIVESVKIFNEWLINKDLGRIRLSEWMVNNQAYPDTNEIGGHHHMGGTRMSINSKFGVVDQNCKVFGSKNIFVAGSSIFTTGGYNNPTLPIVQFSLRLADHLISKTKGV